MDTPTTKPGSPPPEDQREALKDSQRKATEEHPTTFRDESNEQKVVEIPPVGPGKKPIRGIDPH